MSGRTQETTAPMMTAVEKELGELRCYEFLNESDCVLEDCERKLWVTSRSEGPFVYV